MRISWFRAGRREEILSNMRGEGSDGWEEGDSPHHREGQGQGVGVGAGVLLGPGADVGELEARRAVDRDAEAEAPAEVAARIVGRDAVDAGIAAEAVAGAGGEPEAGAEGVGDVDLADEAGVFLKRLAAEELVGVGGEGNRAEELGGPLALVVDPAEPGREGEAVAAEVDGEAQGAVGQPSRLTVAGTAARRPSEVPLGYPWLRSKRGDFPTSSKEWMNRRPAVWRPNCPSWICSTGWKEMSLVLKAQPSPPKFEPIGRWLQRRGSMSCARQGRADKASPKTMDFRGTTPATARRGEGRADQRRADPSGARWRVGVADAVRATS